MAAFEIVTKILSSNSAAKALAKHVFPIDAPQGQQAPYYVLNLVSAVDETTLGGAGKYYRTRVSVECIAASGTTAVAMGSAALAALEDVVKQTIIVGKSRYVDVDCMFDSVDQTASSPNRDLFVRMLHFSLRWRNPLP